MSSFFFLFSLIRNVTSALVDEVSRIMSYRQKFSQITKSLSVMYLTGITENVQCAAAHFSKLPSCEMANCK